MPDEFESIADVDRHYKRRLAEASDEELPTLKLEISEAKNGFYERQASKRSLDDARRSALEKYARAKDFEDLVRGNTAEEIEASAKTIHERMEALMPTPQEPAAAPQAPQPDPAQIAYGQPGVGGAGAPPAQPDREAELFRKMVGAGGGRGRSMTAAESAEYMRSRLPKVLAEAKRNQGTLIGFNGPDVRTALK